MWNEAGQRFIEFCQENALVIENTVFQQHKERLYTWTSPMVITKIRLIIFFAAKDGEALYSQQKTRPGADCGSDHELLITKFRLKLKKVGKTSFHSSSGTLSIRSRPLHLGPYFSLPLYNHKGFDLGHT